MRTLRRKGTRGLCCVLFAWLVFGCRCLLAADAPPLPPGGETLLPVDPGWKLIAPTGVSTILTYERSAVSAGPILQAKTTTMLPAQEAWRTYVKADLPVGLSPGEVIVVTGRARTLETTNSAGKGVFRVHLELREPPQYPKLLSSPFEAPREWTRFQVVHVLKRDLPLGKGSLIFNFGYALQTVELCDVQLHRYPAGFDTKNLPVAAP